MTPKVHLEEVDQHLQTIGLLEEVISILQRVADGPNGSSGLYYKDIYGNARVIGATAAKQLIERLTDALDEAQEDAAKLMDHPVIVPGGAKRNGSSPEEPCGDKTEASTSPLALPSNVIQLHPPVLPKPPARPAATEPSTKQSGKANKDPTGEAPSMPASSSGSPPQGKKPRSSKPDPSAPS